MKTKSAIKLFKTKSALARALKISKQAVGQWGDSVPLLRQFQIERLVKKGR